MRPRNVLFVILMVVTVVALLPLFLDVDASRCEWSDGFEGKGNAEARAVVTTPFGLSVKTGDGDTTKELRAAVEQRLRAAGIANLVDNPVTRPRADLALEEAQLRWLPFYASVHAKGRALLTRPGAGAAAAGYDATARLDGTCYGLVSQTAWKRALVDHLADGLVRGVLPGR
jgi:hypothetical protein